MRDRETDSWWSIMTSTSIGGALDGAELDELPLGEKTTWADWWRRHPDTVVLSVDGEQHRINNPYDSYFESDRTFRDLEISDDRLDPKTPVFSFWLDGQTYAAAHSTFEGGRLFELPGEAARRILLYRDLDAPLFASTQAWILAADSASSAAVTELIAAARSAGPTNQPLDGFDTFWYSWISVNPESALLQ